MLRQVAITIDALTGCAEEGCSAAVACNYRHVFQCGCVLGIAHNRRRLVLRGFALAERTVEVYSADGCASHLN